MKNGDVCCTSPNPHAWFLVTEDDMRGVWLYGGYFQRTPMQTDPNVLWSLQGLEVVPPEKWPPRVCAAVAKEMLSQ
jgi:hypothetical protein